MLERLPDWKELIIRCINSCETHDQLQVCWDFITLFELRFRDWVPPGDFSQHLLALHGAYLTKRTKQIPSIPQLN